VKNAVEQTVSSQAGSASHVSWKQRVAEGTDKNQNLERSMAALEALWEKSFDALFFKVFVGKRKGSLGRRVSSRRPETVEARRG
jgi:hypothetical protein